LLEPIFLIGCARSGTTIIGKFFEKKFAKKINSKYAISFPYARAGLYSFLVSQNLKNKATWF